MPKPKGKVYVGDFETTTEAQTLKDGYTKVWGACLVDIETEEVKVLSTNVNDFLNFLAKDDANHTSKKLYFHNLKFDGQFIVNELFKNGFKHSTEKRLGTKEFSTIVSNTGQFYEIKICFNNYGTRSNQIVIHDSYKKLPFSAERIAKAFNLPISKGTIDYDRYRDFPYTMTPEEEEYIVTDVMIIAKALKIQFSQGLSKMTIGSDAMHNYKKTVGKKTYDYLFPALNLDIDRDLRQSYKGGWVYMKPEVSEVVYNNVLALDVNSLYPHVMRSKTLPFGVPIYYEGKYKKDDKYPLYIQLIRTVFKIKKDHLPTIQLKNNWRFSSTEYLTDSGEEPVEMFLTSVDLQLFLDHYDIIYIEYLEGFKFQAIDGLFNDYIDHWSAIKETSTGAIREIAKLMLNNLYGKFGTNPVRKNVYPVYEDNMVKWVAGEEQEGPSSYVPMASFITSYARELTIRSAQALYPHFLYSDTDSIKLQGITLEEVEKLIEIHPTRLGAWKDEGTAYKFKVLRAKTYISESIDGEVDITCAGLPSDARKSIKFDDFKLGLEVNGKLSQKRVKGGVILKNTTYKIKHIIEK